MSNGNPLLRVMGQLLRVVLMLAAVGCWAQSKTAPTSPPEARGKSAERGEPRERHHSEMRHHRGVAHPPKAMVQDPEPAPAPPPPATLAQQPPNAPQINYRNGLLTVAANNSTMGDILNLVQRKTGADIDYPPSLSQERVAAVVGPAPAPQVLAALLNGTRFDYILVGMNGRPDLLQRAIITASAGGGAAESAGGPPQPRNVAPTPAQEDEEPAEETIDQPEEAPPAQTQPAQQNSNPQQRYPQPLFGQPPAQGEQPQQQQPKTPEQLLQELQRMQQQQIQQQQQQQQQEQ